MCIIFFFNSQKTTFVAFSSQNSTRNSEAVKLAGTASPYYSFNQELYVKALTENKIILLNFYANWCPTCKAEQSTIFHVFDSLDNEEVVGFRVNYKDSATDSFEETLAKEFGIAYQHTKVILKDGKVVTKDLSTWDETKYLQNINEALG